MSEFKVKTRWNSSPDDKPRVYFSCYEDDFETYFEKICEDIFKTHDCAIYYTKDMNAKHDALNMETDLGRMNLFVIPVTRKLLTRSNRTIETDLAFAKKNHIAILPIMMENDIDKIYKKIFGEMQYLKPDSNDPTEIRYEEKLKKRLDEILISKELVERIRAAFDAYIFLSYRKKDRRYANELLKIIHNIPGCYDIAVWYDEFLTPGENFREIIYKMLEKSKMFTLLVTPNLLEEKNFVMKEEYPAAEKSKMNILPTEMVSTDRRQLEEKYSNIPDCIDPHSEEFKHAVSNVVSDILNRDNNDSPEHNYLIGLAYLDGIDVESNSERGISLISAAADAELPEAMKKLVSVYRNRILKRDNEISFYWQKKLIDYYERLFKKDPTEENFDKLFSEILDLGDAYYDMWPRRFNDAKASYRRIEELAKEYGKKYHLAVSYERLGNIPYTESSQVFIDATRTAHSLNNLFNLDRHYIDFSHKKLDKNAKKKKNLYNKLIDFSCNRLIKNDIKKKSSYKNRLSKNLEMQRKLYQNLIDFSHKKLDKKTKKKENLYKKLIDFSYNRLSKNARKKRNLDEKLDEAKQYYIQAFEITNALAEKTGTESSLSLLSLILERLYSIATDEEKIDKVKAEEKFGKAKQCHMQAFEIANALAEANGTARSLSLLSLILKNLDYIAIRYDKLGKIAKKKRKLDEAKQYYMQEFEILKALENVSKTVKVKLKLRPFNYGYGYGGLIRDLDDIAVSYNKLGKIAKKKRKLDKAKQYYMQAIEIGEALPNGFAWSDLKHNLSVSYGQLGDIAVSYNNLGSIAKTKGKLDKAKQYYLQAIEIGEALAEKNGTVESRQVLAECYEKLGSIFAMEGKSDEAKQYYMQASEIRKTLAE